MQLEIPLKAEKPYKIDIIQGIHILLAFLFSFLVYFPFLNYGLEYTDVGYHLANQDLASVLGPKYVAISPWWAFSDILGSWWLRCFDSYGLWGARVGGCLILAMTTAIAARTLFVIYKPNLLIIFAILCCAVYRGSEIIDYNSAPLLFYTLFSLLFLKLHLDPKRLVYQALSGITFVLLILSRVPMAPALMIPVISLLICIYFYKEQFSLIARAYLQTLLITCFCLIGVGFYFQSQGILQEYLNFQTPTRYHNFYSLISLWLRHATEKVPFLLLLTGITILVIYSIKKQKLNYKNALIASGSFFLLCLVFLVLYKVYPEMNKSLKLIRPDIFNLYLIMLALNVTCLYLLKEQLAFHEVALFLLAASFPILRTIGSTAGLNGGVIAGAILHCGITMVWLLKLGTTYKLNGPFTIAGVGLMLLVAYRGVNKFMFRDISIVTQTTEIGAGRLHGIYTTADRATHVRDLIHKIEQYTKKGDRILAFPNIPMIYYASGTLPQGNHTWMFLLNEQGLKSRLEQIAVKAPPKILVKPKLDPQNPLQVAHDFGWPTDADLFDEIQRKMAIFDEIMLPNRRLVWSNDCFEIFH